jgi:MFS family permease
LRNVTPPPSDCDQSRLSLLRHPEFLRLWIVGLALLVARWIDTLVFAVVTYQTTGSAFLVSIVTMLRMLPMGLFGTFMGAMADRIERRTLLIAIVSSSLTTAVFLATMAHLGQLAIWHLALGSFINGVGWAADSPVRRMMIGDLVGPSRVGTAMSIDVGSNFLSRVLGPSIGGLLLASVGTTGSFSFNIGLYAIGVTAALGIRYRNAAAPKADRSFLSGIVEGVKLAWNNAHLRGTLILTVILNLFGWPFVSMIAVIGQDNLGLHARGIGLLASMDGVGACCAAIVIGRYSTRAQYGRIYAGGTILFLAMMMVFPLLPHPVAVAAALSILGLGGAGFAVMQTTLIYLLVEQNMRGRMLGVMATCIGVGPVGYVLLGLLAEAVTAQWATVCFGGIGLLAMAATYGHWRPITARPSDNP